MFMDWSTVHFLYFHSIAPAVIARSSGRNHNSLSCHDLPYTLLSCSCYGLLPLKAPILKEEQCNSPIPRRPTGVIEGTTLRVPLLIPRDERITFFEIPSHPHPYTSTYSPAHREKWKWRDE
ncbi:hypothetical protein YC2023_083809 [Brassica napus]